MRSQKHNSQKLSVKQSVADVTLLTIVMLSISVIGCSNGNFDEMSNSSDKTNLSKADSNLSASEETYVELSFGLSSPLGDQILRQSQEWALQQVDEAREYAQPRMCAHNVSRVLEDTGLPYYGDYLVPNMVSAVQARGGIVARLNNYNKQAFISSLNDLYAGHLPIGSLVNGCLYADCSGEGGDGHIAILGETDAEGVVYLYHNNWYRPDNEGGQRKEYMVSPQYYDELGLRRQWMKTPWIRIHRSVESGHIVDVEGLLPAIDDLDPYTGFFITISIMPELLDGLGLLERDQLFCPDGLKPDPMLGACVDQEENVYGRFSDKMVESCTEKGYGQACTQKHRLEGDRYSTSVLRWSKSVYNSLRGVAACPKGLTLNPELSICVQNGDRARNSQEEVIGLFTKSVVEKCLSWGGGEGCTSGRMSASFYKELIR